MVWDGKRPYATYKYDKNDVIDPMMLTLRSHMTDDEWHGILTKDELDKLYAEDHDPEFCYAFIEVERDGQAYRCVRGDSLWPSLVDSGVTFHDDGSDMYFQMYSDKNSGLTFPIAYTVYDEFMLGVLGSREDNRMPVDSMDHYGDMLSDILPEGIPHRLGGEIYRDTRYGAIKLA